MLFQSTSVLAASLVFAIPFIQDCDLGPSGGGETDEDDDNDEDDEDDDNDDWEPGNECEPEEDDSECRSCLRSSCCDGVQACDDDRSCSCVLGCMSDDSAGLAVCARSRCEVTDITAALEPLTRYCAVDESCGGRWGCEGTLGLPKPQ
ncbi:hypothetical protein [Nannocystis bainbridge]|uniref:Uncharacterized protein n=1 Tax=Nannocystis bainbridge TaxID=2995303 RepID=A0ABT5DW36_9BACT|nr:hypothetical protein [Nannocystis bainbridge]MDC0717836.1 hypothetical protein [Nannocystis bainbridge]